MNTTPPPKKPRAYSGRDRFSSCNGIAQAPRICRLSAVVSTGSNYIALPNFFLIFYSGKLFRLKVRYSKFLWNNKIILIETKIINHTSKKSPGGIRYHRSLNFLIENPNFRIQLWNLIFFHLLQKKMKNITGYSCLLISEANILNELYYHKSTTSSLGKVLYGVVDIFIFLLPYIYISIFLFFILYLFTPWYEQPKILCALESIYWAGPDLSQMIDFFSIVLYVCHSDKKSLNKGTLRCSQYEYSHWKT